MMFTNGRRYFVRGSGSHYLCLAIMLVISLSYPAFAQTSLADQSMGDHVGNAMTQPLRDVNLKKNKIAAKLEQIRYHPYDLTNMRGCASLDYELAQLEQVLGPDVNEVILIGEEEKRERGISQVAGGIIGGLIPFRGVIREISGANAAERDYLNAFASGNARRSFLKGIAVSKGCRPPPREFRLKLPYDYRGF